MSMQGVSDPLAELLESAAQQAFIAASTKLNEEQFELMVLVLKGADAIAKKHALEADDMYVHIRLFQEETLHAMGFSLPQSYVEAKRLLQQQLEDQTIDRLQFAKAIHALRTQLDVDNIVNEHLNALKNPSYYEKQKQLFLHAINLSFIEDDLDVKQKLPSETEAEFRMKVEIYQHLQYFKQMQAGYLQEKHKIIAEHSEAIAFANKAIQPDLDKAKASHDQQLAAQKKLMNYLLITPEAEFANMLKSFQRPYPMDVHHMEGVVKNAYLEAFEAQTPVPASIIEAQKILYINQLINQNYQAFESYQQSRLPLEGNNGFRDMLITTALVEQQKNNQAIESEYQARINRAQDKIKPEIKRLQKSQKQQLKTCKTAHKKALKKANKYYDAEVSPRIRVLQTLRGNKLFHAMTNELSDVLHAQRHTLNQTDANTIAFLVLLKNSADRLDKIELITQIGIKSARDLIAKKTAGKMPSEKGAVKKLIKKVSDRTAAKIGNALAGSSERKAFAQTVAHLEQHCAVTLDTRIESIFDGPRTFVGCYQQMKPVDQEETVSPPQPSEPAPFKSLFEVVQHFDQAENFVGKAKAAYTFYQNMTAPNPDVAAVDTGNPVYTFVAVLQDTILKEQMDIVPLIAQAIKSLDENQRLEGMKHAGNWRLLLRDANDLLALKNKFDNQFEHFQHRHGELRAQYQQFKPLLDTAQVELNRIEEEIKQQKRALNDIEQEQKLAASVQQQGIDKQAIQERLEKLDSYHERNIAQIGQEYDLKRSKIVNSASDAIQKIAAKQEKALVGFPEKMAKLKYERTLAAYEKHYDLGFFSPKPSVTQLNQFLKENPILQEDIQAQINTARSKIVSVYNEQVVQLKQERDTALEKIEAARISDLEEAQQKYHQTREKIRAPIIGAQQRADQIVSDLDRQAAVIRERLQTLESQQQAMTETIQSLESQLKAVIREFNALSAEYKQGRKDLGERANQLIDGILSANADSNVHLQQLQAMLTEPATKMEIFSVTPQILENLALQLDAKSITFADIATGIVQQKREYKQLPKAAQEQDFTDRILANAMHMTAGTIVDVVGGNDLRNARLWADHLDSTLRAEDKFKAQQKLADTLFAEYQAAQPKPISINPAALTPEPPKKLGFWSRLWQRISAPFRAIGDWMRSKQNPQPEAPLATTEIESALSSASIPSRSVITSTDKVKVDATSDTATPNGYASLSRSSSVTHRFDDAEKRARQALKKSPQPDVQSAGSVHKRRKIQPGSAD